jgi:peptide/nickel transport system permease protein
VALFLWRRLLAVVAILLVLTAVLFLLQHITPTDQAKQVLGPEATPAALRAERHALWLDRPLPVQYVHYLYDAIRGDLGDSLRTHNSVISDIRTFFPPTLELAGAAFLIAIILAIVFAASTARDWWGARVFRVLMIGGASAPVFLVALVAILVFYSGLHWLPAGGQSSSFDAPTGPTGLLLVDALVHHQVGIFFSALEHLILPALTAALAPAVAIGRVLRSSVMANLDADYVRTARSKGLSERAILWRHVMRNSVNAALSMTGLQLGLMFAGIVIIEEIFSWPGLGNYTALSVSTGDFPALTGVTLVVGVVYVAVNAVVDVLQAIADPRVQLH